MASITYHPSRRLKQRFTQILNEIAHDERSDAVAELGGGAHPLLGDENWQWVGQRAVFDVSAEELAKSGTSVQTYQADLCQPLDPQHHGKYNLAFSRMLCEHLAKPAAFHQNVFDLLRPGGLACHYFPTLWAFPFVVNWIVPESAASWIMTKVQPGRVNSKFPAYYRWCTGPTSGTIAHYESIGFIVERWLAGFGHTYYRTVPPLEWAERAKSKVLLSRPSPHLTAFSVVMLRKPH